MTKYIVAFLTLLITFMPATIQAGGQGAMQIAITVSYIPDKATVERLAAGDPGKGLILYYSSKQSLDKPSIIVRLSRTDRFSPAQAEVFDATSNANSDLLSTQNGQIDVNATRQPRIVMNAPNGSWTRSGRPDYNFDVQLNGPIYSMWGGGADVKFGANGWVRAVPRGAPSATISVRDPEHTGMPLWDLRSLIPEFKGLGFYRTNYAERKCDSPVSIDLGVSPVWPYVAASGDYEQASGKMRPPIVVDWAQNRISTFSELVTVRNQNCSYSLYSITPVVPGVLNQPDFETPFAFYDLSGEGHGAPNLVVRTGRFPANDEWSSQIESAVQNGQPLQRDMQAIRYSWRNAIGESLWDYKVEVLGSNPYTFKTPIAGGLATIDAPSYEQLPSWVIEHPWPATTFIDTEGNSYQSSEGIYEWSPYDAGVAYIAGWEPEPKRKAFQDIVFGFRGEYRLRKNTTPTLYVSPVDNRLHLLYAEGGLWKLGTDLVMQAHNEGGERYVNGWTRERIGGRGSSSNRTIEEQLWALPNHMLYANATGVELRRAAYQPATFEINPPTDHATWETFRQRTAPLTAQKRDPRNMKGWLDAFPGPSLVLPGAQISDVRQTNDGFRFVLALPDGFSAPVSDLLDLRGLTAGHYVVSYNGRFSVEPFVAPTAVASLLATSFTQNTVSPLPLALRSSGNGDPGEATLEVQATLPGVGSTVVASQTVTLLAGEPITTTLAWSPPLPGNWTLAPKLITRDGEALELGDVAVTVQPSADPSSATILATSTTPPTLPLVLMTLLGFVALAGTIAWQQARIPAEEK